jgi:acetyl-CoA acetyltransferase
MEAVLAALEDAGLEPKDVDAIITDNEIVPPVLAPNEVAGNLGIRQTHSVLGPSSGAGQTVAPLLASMAMKQNVASVFVCYLVLDFGSLSPGAAEFKYIGETTDKEAFEYPFGFIGTPVYYAMAAKRYQELYGLTEAQLGSVSITVRNHGALHPNAQMRRHLTSADYFASPYVSEPLRVLDCCLRTKAAGAFVITSLERARDLKHRPVRVGGVGYGSSRTSRRAYWTQREEFPFQSTSIAARQAFEMAGMKPADMDFAELQDPYSIVTLMNLEECGFCERGEAGSFAEAGNIALGGQLPVNTHGGQLSYGYTMAMAHTIEAVRQLRGDADERQVQGAVAGLVMGYGPADTGVLILTNDD